MILLTHCRSLRLPAFLVSALVAVHAGAAEPAWWSQRVTDGPPVLNSAESNNRGVATVGQGKWMAQCAIAALEQRLGSESAEVRAIKADLFKASENDPHGVFLPGRPATPTAEWLAAQRAPLRVGALKALAAPFYKHLSGLDESWVTDQFHQNGLATEGKHYFKDQQGSAPVLFPWNPAENRNSGINQAPAVMGQLKAVFSLRFETLEKYPLSPFAANTTGGFRDSGGPPSMVNFPDTTHAVVSAIH